MLKKETAQLNEVETEKTDETHNCTETPENIQQSGEKPQNEEAALAPENPAELSPDEKIAELETQLAETRDQLLRKAADFENFRKRMNQDKQSAIEYAN